MVFSGTTAVGGRGRALAVYTGAGTEIGKIAQIIKKTEEKITPLNKQLNKLGIYISIAVVLISFLVLFLDLPKQWQDSSG